MKCVELDLQKGWGQVRDYIEKEKPKKLQDVDKVIDNVSVSKTVNNTTSLGTIITQKYSAKKLIAKKRNEEENNSNLPDNKPISKDLVDSQDKKMAFPSIEIDSPKDNILQELKDKTPQALTDFINTNCPSHKKNSSDSLEPTHQRKASRNRMRSDRMSGDIRTDIRQDILIEANSPRLHNNTSRGQLSKFRQDRKDSGRKRSRSRIHSPTKDIKDH